MDPKNMRLYVTNKSSFIVDQYQKDTCFYDEDAYCYYDIDVNRISLFKQKENKYVIRYEDLNKMNIVSLILKIKNFYYKIHDYNDDEEMIYIENSDTGFFEKIRKTWNNITELMFIDNAPDFVKITVYDDAKYIKANILINTSFVKSTCYKDEIIIVLHFNVNTSPKASLLELINYNE